MFTIDLLKGQGLPEKGKAVSMAVVAVVVAVPVVAAIVMLGFYLRGRIVISIQSGEIAKWQAKVEGLSEAVAQQRKLEKEKTACGVCMAEVDTAINRHTQWSPILATIVANIPESVVLTTIEVRQRSTRIKVPTKEDPKKTKDVSVTVPMLIMSVAAIPQSNGDGDVKNFRSNLLASDMLGPKLENITVSQKPTKLNNLEVVSHEINCLFKPKL